MDVKVGDTLYLALWGHGCTSPDGHEGRIGSMRCEWVHVYYVGEHYVTVEVMAG